VTRWASAVNLLWCIKFSNSVTYSNSREDLRLELEPDLIQLEQNDLFIIIIVIYIHIDCKCDTNSNSNTNSKDLT